MLALWKDMLQYDADTTTLIQQPRRETELEDLVNNRMSVKRRRGLTDEQVKEMLVLSSLATNSAPPMPQQHFEVIDKDEAATLARLPR